MSAPGTPARDAAAATCRNEQHELAEIYNRIAAASSAVVCDVSDQTALEIRGALSCIDRAVTFLGNAADDLYRDEEGDA